MHRRRVIWSDSDPAGIAYTGRFAAFALEAIEAWCAERLGVSWFASQRSGVILPFVHMELDFRAPLRPDDEVATMVLLDRLGQTSVATRVLGHRADGVLSFQGRFVQVAADGHTMRKQPLPPAYRVRAQAELDLATANAVP